MHVSFTPERENQIKRKVDSGLYNNASEVIRKSLRLMLERDAVRERLRGEIQVGYEQLKRWEGVTVTNEAEFQALVRAAR